jgi:hypothetical protein
LGKREFVVEEEFIRRKPYLSRNEFYACCEGQGKIEFGEKEAGEIGTEKLVNQAIDL